MTNKPKICFVITTVGHGLGGHFHSLQNIITTLNHNYDITLVNIGKKISPVFDSLQISKHFIPYHKFSLTIYTLIRLHRLVKHIQPHVIHAYDVESYFFCRIIAYLNKIPLVLTKSGGPNPKKYFPQANNLIVYSKENYDYFRSHNKFKQTNIRLIANRTQKPLIDNVRIIKLKEKHSIENKIILLRIGRISEHYFSTIKQGLALTQKLIYEYNISCVFLLIGTIQSNESHNLLKQSISENALQNNVIIESDNEFTSEASALLSIGDIILGTGRNFMEACALGKHLLVPNKSWDIPLLVDNNEMFNLAFRYNFSPRIEVDNKFYDENLQKIVMLLNHPIKENTKAIQWFENTFDVNKAIEQYQNFYNSLTAIHSMSISDVILHYSKLQKTFLFE